MEQNKEQRQKLDPNLALDTINNLADKYKSLREIRENNKTERERIKSEEKRVVKQIEATKEVLMAYLNKSFDERAFVFKKNFEAIDTAIKNNNMEALAATIQSVNMLAAQSPFKALVDIAQARKNLINNDEIEL